MSKTSGEKTQTEEESTWYLTSILEDFQGHENKKTEKLSESRGD